MSRPRLGYLSCKVEAELSTPNNFTASYSKILCVNKVGQNTIMRASPEAYKCRSVSDVDIGNTSTLANTVAICILPSVLLGLVNQVAVISQPIPLVMLARSLRRIILPITFSPMYMHLSCAVEFAASQNPSLPKYTFHPAISPLGRSRLSVTIFSAECRYAHLILWRWRTCNRRWGAVAVSSGFSRFFHSSPGICDSRPLLVEGASCPGRGEAIPGYAHRRHSLKL